MDWHASAKLSAARDADEFVVRAHQADEAPRVVLVCDRRPAMSVFGAPFPWLSKPAALRAAAQLIVLSAVAARGDVGALDYAGAAARHGDPYWLPPGGRGVMWLIEQRQAAETGFDAPDDNLEQAIAYLGRMRSRIAPGASSSSSRTSSPRRRSPPGSTSGPTAGTSSRSWCRTRSGSRASRTSARSSSRCATRRAAVCACAPERA